MASEAPKMYYRILGNTGLAVSVLSYGFWATFGVKDTLREQQGIDMAKDCLRLARNAGVNCFDNAEVYGSPSGEAERIMGEAMAQLRKEDEHLWRRSALVITTKIFWCAQGDEGTWNEKGLSRKHIMEGMDASLKRLQLDYVDLVFCHRPDPYTSTETVVQAMTDLVRSGKATAWGTSEWSAQQITEAYYIAERGGMIAPAFEQPQYNMMHRERFEKEYFPLYRRPYNIGTTIWSPLASGLLTNKYKDGIPEDSRLAQKGYEWLVKKLDTWKADGSLDKVQKLADFAEKELQCSVSQLALAWCLKNKNVSTVLLGATKTEQLEENLAAIPVLLKLTDEHMTKIDEILGNKPESWECQMRPLPLI
mmetsp:Transcript_4384/g.9474  ORF Transcript_4384/g.9474 Transcript_4384/m.9474 type:complete len:364 (-) Transcript_4384:88-1179(-)|eukprot:CAMPEP_0171491900 /NCGR_PEP_ID=MMETSP0958-20121227/4111_1 /TAXON_ID=87120 /ORGANISM="Aurantiochytrium limacinum, Strain ATCCMYA-1381" /LENGTH=363 /DNA_ID=CAMNT_0012025359 /DNA_START=156 /DNA_END=1247 /DNA_ORIENTATION=-